MKKLLQLIRVLFKCGAVGKAETSNSAVGDTKTLITLGIGMAAIVGTFMGGQYAAEHLNLLGSGSAVFTTILSAAGMVSFFMTMMTAVNQLYLSSDLDVLITLPFSPMQIVTAKMISISAYPLGICSVLAIPTAVGFFLKSEGLSPLFIPAIVIGALLLAIYVLMLVASLLMIVMRLFRFVRSRNIISIVTTMVMFGLTMGYIFLTSNHDTLDEAQAVGFFKQLNGISSNLGLLFPTVGFSVDAAFGQPMALLYALLCTVGIVVLLIILAKTIYFSAALGMTDANGSRTPIKDAEMKKYTAKASLGRTLARREVQTILRTPAMITNGYLYSIVVPFVIIIPLAINLVNSFVTEMNAAGAAFSLDMMLQMFHELNLSPTFYLIGGSLFSMLIASLAVALSCLSRFMISREGKDFAVLKTMPITGRKLVAVKRNVAMSFNGISGLIIPVLIFITLAVLQIFPIWVSAVCIVVNICWIVLMIDFCATVDVQKPNLNWETETDVMKSNYPGMILLGISFAVLIGVIFLLASGSVIVQSQDLILAIVLCAVPVVGAVVCDIRLMKAADTLF